MKFTASSKIWGLVAILGLGTSWAIDLDLSSRESICNAASLIAGGMMDYYEGDRYGGTVGMFQAPYYWWQAGEAWGGLLDMWWYCQNDTYEQTIYDALLHQTGDDFNYVPTNQSLTEGNDDQGLWGVVVMAAAERNFTNPPDDVPGWLALSQAVFNTMWARWDTAHCGGGLRWQIFSWNSGYTYKNTISNGCLFNIGARLARYTENDTYVENCEVVWDWVIGVGFAVESDNGFNLYDGASIDDNCTALTESQWTYNFGMFLAGCAYLYNYTEDSIWHTRAEHLLAGASIFFNSSNGIMYERQCQTSNTCNTDERSFRSVFSRMLGLTSILMPDLRDTIDTYLSDSAMGALSSCVGGTDGHTCGLSWFAGGHDGVYGLGEQMALLEVIQNNLANTRPAPYTQYRGGSSRGNVNAGLGTGNSTSNQNELVIEQKDKVGAAVLTAVVLAIMFGGSAWMIV